MLLYAAREKCNRRKCNENVENALKCTKMLKNAYGKKPHHFREKTPLIPKQVGICSHVLTINHMMKLFNVRFQLKSVQTNALKKKAGLMGVTIGRHRCQPFSASPKWSPTPATKRRSDFSSLGSRADRTSPGYVS